MFKHPVKSLLLFFTLFILIIALYQWNSVPESQAFINGQVLTMTPEGTIAQAVLIEGERITAVGSTEEILSQTSGDTAIYDLQNKTLVPGFIDAHGHFPGSGITNFAVDLNSPPIGKISNMEQLLTALQKKATATTPGEWILGISYDDTMLAEQRHPLRQELDKILPDHPVFLMHISGHMGVANSLALTEAGINKHSPDPDGGHYAKDSTGELTGLLEENAAKPVQAKSMDFSALDFLKMVKSASKNYASVGVTTAQSGGVDKRMAQGMALADTLGMVPFRLELWPLFDELAPQLLSGEIEAKSLESGMINLGAIKIIADGSIQGFTGYLSHPYHTPFHGDESYRGYPRTPRKDLFEWVEKYHNAGYQLAIHGNGDASIDDILDAFENAQAKNPRRDTRHIIVHAQMARTDQLDRMKTLGVTPTFFVAHTYYWGDRHRDIFIGPERAAQISPTATALEKGLPFTIHLDTPVVPMKPMRLVWTAVNRLSVSNREIGTAERITPMQALRAVTIDAAWQIFQEDNRGSIEIGKYADLVVLAKDPLTNPKSLHEIDVEQTMVGGRTIFQREPARNIARTSPADDR